jgi:hypothetical protein
MQRRRRTDRRSIESVLSCDVQDLRELRNRVREDVYMAEGTPPLAMVQTGLAGCRAGEVRGGETGNLYLIDKRR